MAITKGRKTGTLYNEVKQCGCGWRGSVTVTRYVNVHEWDCPSCHDTIQELRPAVESDQVVEEG